MMKMMKRALRVKKLCIKVPVYQVVSILVLEQKATTYVYYYVFCLQNAKEWVLQGVVDFNTSLLQLRERHVLLRQVQNDFTGVVFLLAKAARFQTHVATKRFYSFRKRFSVHFKRSILFVRLVARFAFKMFRDVAEIG